MNAIFKQGHAIVVGVGADLPVTVDDATAFANLLRDSTRRAFLPSQVQLLTDETARRDSILAALDWLADSTNPDTTFVVYFSGHGMEFPDYYLIPFGYDVANLANTAISGQIFTEHLQRIRAKKLLVLLDCCHAGGQVEAKGGVKSPLPSSVIEQLGRSSGRSSLRRRARMSNLGQVSRTVFSLLQC